MSANPETLESLLEFLTISGRVAVVQLEPPRAAQFADALRLAMEFGEARAAKLTTERDMAQRAAAHWEGVAAANALDVVTEVAAEREACAKVCDAVEAEQSQWASSVAAHHCAKAIRARGGPVAHEGSPTLREAEE